MTGLDSTSFQRQAVAMTLGQLHRREAHDPDFRAFAAWRGEPIGTILDVGANRGQSVVSLHSVFPDATIHCCEANPLFFGVLAQIAESLGGRCIVHRFGLGKESGELSLYVPWARGEPFLEESSTVLDYFEKPWVAEKFAQRGGLTLERHVVEIRRGDELGLDPGIVKIDVEGAESLVIAGLAETIRRARPMLLVENSDWHGVTELLARDGYLPYRYEAAEGRLVPFYGATTNCFYLLDPHLAGFGID